MRTDTLPLRLGLLVTISTSAFEAAKQERDQPLVESAAAAPRLSVRTPKRWRFLATFALLGMFHEAVGAEDPDRFCRNVDEESTAGEGVNPRVAVPRASVLLDLRVPEGRAADSDSVWELLNMLRREFDVPVSFIEHEADEPIALAAAERTVDEVLRTIADRYTHYFCEAFGDRLVLRTSDPLFDVVVPGVDLVEEYQYPARHAYIDHLRAFDPRFENWQHAIYAITGGGPEQGRVTLSPRAPLILHLVQLLGRDRALYFVVPARRRTINFRAVLRPYERIRIQARQRWANETVEKQ